MVDLETYFEDGDYRLSLSIQFIHDFNQSHIRISKLAARSNIMPSTLYKIHSAKARPSHRTFIRLCCYYSKIFGEPHRYIFNDYYQDNQGDINQSLFMARKFIDIYQ